MILRSAGSEKIVAGRNDNLVKPLETGTEKRFALSPLREKGKVLQTRFNGVRIESFFSEGEEGSEPEEAISSGRASRSHPARTTR